MDLREIGEFGFIDHLKPLFKDLNDSKVYGIGDDCAIIPANDEEDWLITTDLLTDGIHFLINDITPYQLGYKSMAVNLSDMAAMGGTPFCSFLSIAIPTGTSVEYLDEFMRGYHDISKKYNTALLGGDTTKSAEHLTINVVVVGKCRKGAAKTRSAAKEGDLICTTGFLGDSAAGLQLILDNIKCTEAYYNDHSYLLDRHHIPEPRVNEGLFLSTFNKVNAMMDISDGIASDLRHILEQTGGIDAIVHLDNLPLSPALRNEGKMHEWNILQMATCGGEDYELLFTIDRDEFETINAEYEKRFGSPLHCIGEITPGAGSGPGCIHWMENGKEVHFIKDGFNHFAK